MSKAFCHLLLLKFKRPLPRKSAANVCKTILALQINLLPKTEKTYNREFTIRSLYVLFTYVTIYSDFGQLCLRVGIAIILQQNGGDAYEELRL